MQRLDWAKLLAPWDVKSDAEGKITPSSDIRSRFERDYDRIIFSSAFRRLQRKTQVYPLPGFAQVHNRLTHTLEVASVGRSFGKMLSQFLKTTETGFYKYYPSSVYESPNDLLSDSLQLDLSTIIATACLAHDIGNPPFGHFGEKAIGSYFDEGYFDFIRSELNYQLSEVQKRDLMCYDGNANSFRVLTKTVQGERPKGYLISYPTLASIVKYPWSSEGISKKNMERRKYKFGFFTADESQYHQIASRLGLKNGKSYVRHPLVFLMEAADDICNTVVDIQDAHHLKIITLNDVKNVFIPIIENFYKDASIKRYPITLSEIKDEREKVNYLRGLVINVLTISSFEVFKAKYSEIMLGQYDVALFDGLDYTYNECLQNISDIKSEKLFGYSKVLQLEASGYEIINYLLEKFSGMIIERLKVGNDDKYLKCYARPNHRHLLKILPNQFKLPDSEQNTYLHFLNLVDFVANMTDEYALDLKKKISGDSIPELY